MPSYLEADETVLLSTAQEQRMLKEKAKVMFGVTDKDSFKGPLEKVCGYRSTIKILFCPFIKLNNG